MTLQVKAPLPGRVVAMADVPDPVFAGSVVGPGIAIDPPRSELDVVSPVTGRLLKLHPHAFVVLSESGSGVLVHLGIDTVHLKGAGFVLHAQEGADVKEGQRIVSWNPADIEAGGRSPVCPVVAMDAATEDLVDLAGPGQIEAGAALFTWSG